MAPPDFVQFLSLFPMACWPVAVLIYVASYPSWVFGAGFGRAIGELVGYAVFAVLIAVAVVLAVLTGLAVLFIVLAGVAIARARADD